MIDCKYLFLKYFLLFLSLWCGAPYAAAPRDEADIERWLTRHAARAQGTELAGLRQRAVGDLDGDDRMDTVVLYTLKPRDARRGVARYLAAFKRQQGALAYHGHALVSGPGAGEANRVTVLNRMAVVEMLTYAPGDAACCPTKPTVRRYHLSANGLALVGTERKPRSR